MPKVPGPVLELSAPLSCQIGTEASLVSPLLFAKVGLLKRCTATQDEETTDELEQNTPSRHIHPINSPWRAVHSRTGAGLERSSLRSCGSEPAWRIRPGGSFL